MLLNNLNIPQQHSTTMWKAEAIEECWKGSGIFQNNKSPGLLHDKIPIEFYKSCWDLITQGVLGLGQPGIFWKEKGLFAIFPATRMKLKQNDEFGRKH